MKRGRIAALAVALLAAGATATVLALPAGGQTPDETRGLTVTGTGSVAAAPDRAEWSFGVQTEAASAREALRRNAAAMQKVIDALKAAGVAAGDLRTEQVSLFPRTSPEGTDVVGYTATNSVHAVVRDLSRAGAIVDAAAEAGANQIFGPTLTVSDSEEIYNQALEQAFDEALAKGKRLAAKAGVALGRAVSIVEGGGGAPIPVGAGGRAEDQAASAPIEPGLTEIQAIVAVTFAIS